MPLCLHQQRQSTAQNEVASSGNCWILNSPVESDHWQVMRSGRDTWQLHFPQINSRSSAVQRQAPNLIMLIFLGEKRARLSCMKKAPFPNMKTTVSVNTDSAFVSKTWWRAWRRTEAVESTLGRHGGGCGGGPQGCACFVWPSLAFSRWEIVLWFPISYSFDVSSFLSSL